MPFLLAAAALLRHRARTLLAVFGVAIAAAMLLDMVMLATGMRVSFAQLLEDSGYEIRVTPRGTLPFDTEATIGDAAAVRAELLTLGPVVAVAPVLGAALHVPGDTAAVSAFGLGVDPQVQGDYTVIVGRNSTAPDDVVASAAFLTATGAAVGDTVEIFAGYDAQLRTFSGRRQLVIAGEGQFRYLGADQRAVALPLPTLQAMGDASRRDRVSLFMVGLHAGVDADSAAALIDREVPRVTAISTREAVALAEERLSYFRQLALILGAVSLIVGFLLVTTIVTVSVNERIGEIAVMRAIGISRRSVLIQIVTEGLALSLVGAVLGLGLGLLTGRYLESILASFPGLPAAIRFFLFQPSAAFMALGMLVVSGVIAGIYPAWRAASLPVAATLREEVVA